jgi:tungstate transport system substrate-binding protein
MVRSGITTYLLIIVVVIFSLATIGCSQKDEPEVMTISTTTSLYDTGLLEDAIAPAFKEKTGIELHFIPKGTGAAIQDAKNGAADAVLVHAPSVEFSFIENGYGLSRKVIAYNFFTIVGTPEDPAGIKASDPITAMKKIAEAGREGKAIWVSRDDGSGTNVKEQALWEMAGFDYEKIKNEPWFRNTGTGMGKTLLYTNNIGGYTLSDMGTYLKYRKDGLIDLEVLVDKGEELINIYSIIAVNPEKSGRNNLDRVIEFEKWLSTEGQQILANYGLKEYGRALFYPVSQADERTYQWIVEHGFFDDNGRKTECPKKYRYGDLNFLES